MASVAWFIATMLAACSGGGGAAAKESVLTARVSDAERRPADVKFARDILRHGYRNTTQNRDS
jgi:hypothetical protein